MKKELVQSELPAAEKLQRLGWKYVPAKMLPHDPSEPLLLPVLKESIRRLNPGIREEEVEQAINYLKMRFYDVEGCKAVLDALKLGVPVKDKREGIVRMVKIIDYEDIDTNDFIFSRQVYFKGLKGDIPDIVLYINGIPLAIIECKSMTKSWKQAYSQIKRYEEEVPELFKYVQLSVALADREVYFPNVRWLRDVPVYQWDEELGYLKREILLDILRYFLFFREDKGEWTKVLPRYMQYRAVSKIVRRAVKYACGETDRNRGLIWHWQGSGKTLTMIWAAYKLREILGNPTIFFILDRIDLQEQLAGELKSLSMPFEIVSSISHLKRVLSHADGKRGIFVTLIQKFREEELKNFREELKKRRDSILKRRDVIAFVDEGHRSQYGDLAATMRSILSMAAFFAFTGTPLAVKGRDTYANFGYVDEPYLDRYFIVDSIMDGFTVKIAYQGRPDIAKLQREYLEAFLESKLEEIGDEIREDVERELKARLNTMKVILESPERIEKIARDVAAHYTKVRPFKAMVVAVSREACVKYKRALDELMPPEQSEIVMTFGEGDSEIIEEYGKELQSKYKNRDMKEIREEIIKRFKKYENPKILIVTDMLLTGFDAPVLQTMYLDKPLKGHRLLQAIARTNRPMIKDGENIKPFGLIIDYIGVFSELEKALASYDEKDIVGIAYNFDEIKKELEKKMDRAIELAGAPPSSGLYDRDSVNLAILRLEEKGAEKEFFKLYREIRNLYRLLLEERLEFKEKFSWLTEVYYAYNRKVKGIDPEIELIRDKFLQESLEFIHRTIDIEKIRTDFPIVEIDEEFLNKVAKGDKIKKFHDLLFAVRSYIERGEVIDEDIVERVERIVTSWRERQKDLEELYEELKTIATGIYQEKVERNALNIDKADYEVLKILRKKTNLKDDELINRTKEIMNIVRKRTFPGWNLKNDVVNEISREILLYLIPLVENSRSAKELRDDLIKVIKRVVQ